VRELNTYQRNYLMISQLSHHSPYSHHFKVVILFFPLGVNPQEGNSPQVSISLTRIFSRPVMELKRYFNSSQC